VALTWNGKKLDWTNVIYFSVIHAGALLAPWMFSWTALGIALFLYWLTASVGITLTYHRLLTHRGFRIPKPLEYLFTLCGMLASEGGAITWVAMHRLHHTLSDREGRDLHTPKDGFCGATSAGSCPTSVCRSARSKRAMPPRWWPTPCTAR
jgi:stearoyl-CoA desaturase (delta-9 desaturase)